MKNISETRSWCNWHYVRILITQNIWELFQLFSFIYRVILLHNTCMYPRNTTQNKIWRSSPINGSFDRKGKRKVVDLLYIPQQQNMDRDNSFTAMSLFLLSWWEETPATKVLSHFPYSISFLHNLHMKTFA